MSGYCPDCGNTLCLCDDLNKQRLADQGMSDEMKDREFWIHELPVGRSIANKYNLYSACDSKPQNPGWIKVVDHAAYEAALKMIEKLTESLSECEGHFLSIELDYGAEVGNTPKMIASNALISVRQALEDFRKFKEGL